MQEKMSLCTVVAIVVVAKLGKKSCAVVFGSSSFGRDNVLYSLRHAASFVNVNAHNDGDDKHDDTDDEHEEGGRRFAAGRTLTRLVQCGARIRRKRACDAVMVFRTGDGRSHVDLRAVSAGRALDLEGHAKTRAIEACAATDGQNHTRSRAIGSRRARYRRIHTLGLAIST